MLNKKLLRDIKFNKSQFITIFIMVFLGVFVFSGIHAYMDGMQESADNYYEKNNLQDMWLLGENFSSNDLSKVKELQNIKDAERKLTITTTLDNFNDVTIETNFIESNNISKMYVIDGEQFDINKSGVWIDSYLANNLNLKVGDEIAVTYQSHKIKEKILGLINIPDHVYAVKDETAIFPNHKDFGYIYLSINEFPENYIYDEIRNKMIEENPMLSMIDKDMIESMIEHFDIKDYYVFNQIIVDVDDLSKLNDTKAELEDEITSAIAVTDRNSSASYENYNSKLGKSKNGNAKHVKDNEVNGSITYSCCSSFGICNNL